MSAGLVAMSAGLVAMSAGLVAMALARIRTCFGEHVDDAHAWITPPNPTVLLPFANRPIGSAPRPVPFASVATGAALVHTQDED
jgi:hypothetical protein